MPRDRESPRISICKNAEYMVASPGRRRAILRDQKYPSAFKAGRFREAYAAIVTSLLRGGNPRLLDEHIDEWRRRQPSGKFEAGSLELCIEALMAFKLILAGGGLAGHSFAPGLTAAYFQLGGVELSVRPDLLIGGPEAGAVKLYLVKTAPLSPDVGRNPGSSSYATAMLHQWAEREFGTASTDKCLVVDVFGGAVYSAPSHYAQRRENIEAACEEIAARWASIRDPRAESAGPLSHF